MLDLRRVWGQRLGMMVTAVGVPEDGSSVACGTKDKRLTLYDIEGKVKWNKTLALEATGIDFAGDGSAIMVSANYDVWAFSPEGGVIWSSKVKGIANHIAIATNGAGTAVACADGNVYYYNRTGVLLWRYPMEGQVTRVGVNGDGSKVVAGDTNGILVVLNGAGHELLKMRLPYDILTTSITRDGEVVVVGSYNHLSFLDLAAGKDRTFDTEAWIKECHCDEKGDIMAIGSNGVVTFFNREFQPFFSLSPEGWVHSLRVTANSKYIVVGYGDDYLEFYENLSAAIGPAPKQVEENSNIDFWVTRDDWDNLQKRLAAMERKVDWLVHHEKKRQKRN